MLHDWVRSAEMGLGRKVSDSLGLAEVLPLPVTGSRTIRNYRQGLCSVGASTVPKAELLAKVAGISVLPVQAALADVPLF